MILGIDLGTTNTLAAINQTIIGNLMVPSIACIKDGRAGEQLRHCYGSDYSRNYKVNISLGREGAEAVKSSELVLRELMSIVRQNGYKTNKAVITVPAYFTANERQATKKAAEAAGIDVISLLNEPTAAALYYTRNKPVLVVVVDLGGGTFDVSVIDGRFGNYQVQATKGNKIGGNLLDKAIMKYAIKQTKMPLHRFNSADISELEALCEQAKITIQKTREDQTFTFKDTSVTLTVGDYIKLMKHTFAETLTIAKSVISTNIQEGDPYKLLFVGGSTRDPFYKEWIAEELGVEPEPMTYDPDRIVAQGASYYADMVESGEAEIMVSDVTKALGIKLSDGTVRNIIPANSIIPTEGFIRLTNPEDAMGLDVALYQGDYRVADMNTYLGQLKYDFNEVKKARTASVEITVAVAADGLITLRAKEMLKPAVEVQLDVSSLTAEEVASGEV